MTFPALLVVLVLVLATVPARAQCPVHAPFQVLPANTATCLEFQFIDGMWQIQLLVTGNPDRSIAVQCVQGKQSIRYLRVQAERGPFPNGTVTVSVTENGGTIARLDEVSYLPAASPANLSVASIQIAGTLGASGTPNSGLVVADYINSVSTNGDMAATLLAGPPLFSSTGISDIVLVRSSAGDVLGHIVAYAGSIHEVVAPNGDIGTEAFANYILAKRSIRRITARAIWADIDSTFGSAPSDSSEVWRIATTAGGFTGSLTAKNIDGATPASDGIIVAGGDLDADITILNEVRNRVQVSGALPAGRTMYVGSSLTGSGTTMNFGALAGTLAFGGNIDKPITVNGPMTGIIAAGGSLTQPMTFGTASAPGLEGLVLLNDAAGGGTWAADIRVAGPASPPLSPAPYYSNTDYSVGGGSVALVPTRLHGESCAPPRNQTTPPVFGSAEFCNLGYLTRWTCLPVPATPAPVPYGSADLRLTFYGPVFAEDPTVCPVYVWYIDPQGVEHNDPETDVDYAAFIDWSLIPDSSGGFARTLILSGRDQTQLIAGRYRVRSRLNGGARLLSDGLLVTLDVPVGENFAYDFQLYMDCNRNGVDDAADIAANPTLDADMDGRIDCCAGPNCLTDYTLDGNSDQDDVSYLTNVISGGENPSGLDPDFNHDGNADQDDIAALIDVIGGGDCPNL